MWQTVWAILFCTVFVYVIARSLWSQWRHQEPPVPLQGRYHAARSWLEAHGYQVVRVRERCDWIGYYGHRRFVRPLVADFIVRQGARYYAVRLARPRDPLVSGVKLRDEWYPLYVAFGVHGILHIDVEEEQVQVVDFEVRQPSYLAWRRMVNRSLWFLGGALAALAWLHSR